MFEQALAEHSDDVHGIAFTADGKWLASSGEDTTLRVWQMEQIP